MQATNFNAEDIVPRPAEESPGGAQIQTVAAVEAPAGMPRRGRFALRVDGEQQSAAQ